MLSHPSSRPGFATPGYGPEPQVRYRHVIVEGPIGAGKTSLATRLAELWSLRTEFEQPQANPFLDRFYRDTSRYALPAQLHFLTQRAEAMQRIAATDSPLISDFMPQKDALFARLTLADDEFALYQALARHVALPVREADLVIYLRASPEILFARIQRRALAMEAQISDAYLRALCDAYDDFFSRYTEAPLFTVDTRNLNLVDNDHDLTLLLERIRNMRGRNDSFVKGSA